LAKYKVAGKTAVVIDNALGTRVDMTAYIDSIGALGKEMQSLDVTTFADAAERVIAGIESSQEFTISGAFDDTATTGPDAVFSARVGTLGTWEYYPIGTALGSRKFSAEALCTAYRVKAEAKGRVEYEAVFKQDGTVTTGTGTG